MEDVSRNASARAVGRRSTARSVGVMSDSRNHAFERMTPSALRLLAVHSSLRSSAAAQRERYAS